MEADTPVDEIQNQPFRLSFNPSLRVDSQGSHVTSDDGLILVRELEERLGLSELIGQHLTDPRGKNIQLPCERGVQWCRFPKSVRKFQVTPMASSELSADPSQGPGS